MEFPPEPKTPYVLDKEQDKRIFAKLARFQGRTLTEREERLVQFLYTQLETDWRTPLENLIDDLLQKPDADAFANEAMDRGSGV